MQIKPTIWQRVNMAARLMRGEPFRNLPSQVKQAPGSIFIWPDFRKGSPVWASGNFEDYALEGFQRNSLIYSAIMFKVRAQMAAPLRAYEGDVDAPTPLKANHPLAQLLARPNLYMSWPEFQGINTVYLNLAGETFIALLRPRMGGMVERMLPLRPDRCFPIPDNKGGLKGYFYCPENVNPANGIPMALEDVIHIKLPNPLDPLEGLGRGLSPLASLAYSASVDNMITEFLYGFFKTGAMPTGILRFNVPLQAEEADRIKERWHELHGGYEKWSDVAVLDNAGEYQRVGLTFEEMGFLGIDERNESRILGPFGVPPILIGSRMGMLHSTYSNYEQARKAFWEDTFKPELSMYELEYKYYLQGDGGEFVAFDYSDVPALQKDVIPAVAAWAQMVDRGVPKNVAAGVLKIPLPALPDDDVGYMPPTMQPVGSEPLAPAMPALPEPEPEAEPDETEDGAAEAEEQAEDEGAKAMKRPFEFKALAAEQKADHWKRFDATARKHEEAMKRVAIKRFREDEKEYLAAITGAKRKSIEDKATIDWEYLTSQWDKATFESEKLWEADLIPVLKGVITDAGEQLGQTVGLSFTLPDIRGAAWFNRYVLKFAKNDATQITDATKDQLSALLQQAKIEGWSMRDLEKQLGATFDRFLGKEADLSEEERAWFAERNVPYRIENIARTETIRASNGGNFDLMRAWGAPQHEWLATMDPPRAREDHMDVNGHIVDVGDYFYVGGEKMLYPGDPSASAGNVVNCRCTTVPVGIEDMDKPKPFDPNSESIGQ